MKIHSLSIEHFMSFRDRVEVPMHNQGLVVVKGQNNISESADSNGSGKTSLIVHAPSWILFGMTPNGLRGDEVACRFTDEMCLGRMELEDEQGKWAIIRARRPAALQVEGTDWDGEDMKSLQARIESRLGWGFRTFKSAVIFGQGNFERFSQAEQADQLKMLDEIQGVDFTKALERTLDWGRGQKSKAQSMEQAIKSGEESSVRLAQAVKQLESARESFEAIKKAKIKELEGQEARLVTEKDHAHKRLEELTGKSMQLASLRDLWKQIETAIIKAREARREAEMAAFSEARECLIYKGREKELEDLLAKGKCPTCTTEFIASVEKKVRAAFLPAITEAKKAYTAAKQRAQEKEEARQLVDAVVEDTSAKWPYDKVDESALTALENEAGPAALERARQEYNRMSVDIGRVVGEIESEKKRRFEASETLETSKQQLQELEKELKETRKQLEGSQKAVRVAAYWSQAFGDKVIRSLLIDSVAGFLNDRLAHHLSILAAGEVQVEVSAMTVLKGGGQKERLSITPVWGWGAAGAGLGSAGQDRRVDLALFAALQDLAESRSARPFPLKIFDEPFDALDSKGKEIAGGWARNQAAERGTAFLMTHSEELASVVSPDAVWTVVLDENGSHVVFS